LIVARSLSTLAAVLAALLSAPVAAQEQNSYEAGVAARQSGRPVEARRLLRAWLAANPDDIDAKVQLAYAELAIGNLEEAEVGFATVLRAAPEYVDARDGLALVAARRNSANLSDRGFALIEAAVSDLSGSTSDWSEIAGEVQIPAGSVTLGARASWYRRFGLEDVEMTGHVGLHPYENVWLRAHAGGTPNADFRPELDLGGGVDVRLGNRSSTVVTFDGTWQRFPAQDVVTISPGIVQYMADGKAWLTVRGIGLIADGAPFEVGALLRADYQPNAGWRVFGGAANGPDTDIGVVTRVTSVFGGFEAPLGNRLGVVGSIGRDWRNGGFDRTEFRLGLKAKF
jgi:YaiO family outer membrane protein